jgi:hypothetical protein
MNPRSSHAKDSLVLCASLSVIVLANDRCEDERRQWRAEQSVARSRVYEQSDVRLAAANRGVRCRRRRQRSDGRHVPAHDVINT